MPVEPSPDQRPDRASPLLALDALCDQFERAWQQAESPRIEAFLDRVEPPRRAELLAELLPLELAYRGQRNEPALLEAYLARFPDLAAAVRQAILPPAAADAPPAQRRSGRPGQPLPNLPPVVPPARPTPDRAGGSAGNASGRLASRRRIALAAGLLAVLVGALAAVSWLRRAAAEAFLAEQVRLHLAAPKLTAAYLAQGEALLAELARHDPAAAAALHPRLRAAFAEQIRQALRRPAPDLARLRAAIDLLAARDAELAGRLRSELARQQP